MVITKGKADMGKRETLRDWRKEWIQTNGETHDLEVVVRNDEKDELYEGCFLNMPLNLLDKKVVKTQYIITSSCPERVGAYILEISI